VAGGLLLRVGRSVETAQRPAIVCRMHSQAMSRGLDVGRDLQLT
jgi:hypothetical protein